MPAGPEMIAGAASASLQSLGGQAQMLFGLLGAKKAQRKLENLKSPLYHQNSSIMDYYNKALSRYNVNPYDSNLYKMQEQQANRNVAQGIGGLQDRRSAIAGIPALLQAKNDSMLRAGVSAENERDQRFNQLGAATNMKADEDRTAWQYNEYMPYETKFNLLSSKAAAKNQLFNAGMSNYFGGIGNLTKLGASASK